MSVPFRRNHFIPSSILSYWVTRPSDRSYAGVWVYEIAQKKKYFANAQGREAFRFAVSNDLYVPVIDQERATATEEWLSALERTLATFNEQIYKRTEEITFPEAKDLTKLLMALFALECRSPHNVTRSRTAVERDSSFRTLIGADPHASSHQAALENLITYASEMASRYADAKVSILHSSGGGVILSDRPVFNAVGRDMYFFSLTNRTILSLENSGLPYPFIYNYKNLDADFLATLNHRIALEARAWIVAADEPTLDIHIAVIESDEWRDYCNSQGERLEPVTHLRTGWTIPKIRVPRLRPTTKARSKSKFKPRKDP